MSLVLCVPNRQAMDDLDRLAQAVQQSPKYRRVCTEVVRNIGVKELASHRSWKGAVKATRNKLHQIGAAYLDGAMAYEAWLRQLRAARNTGEREAMLQACREIMEHQSSTRERLGILDGFYRQALAEISPVSSVLDIACGLNPLAIPWMPLAADAEYYAYDIYTDMMGFLNEFLGIAGVRGQAEARDVTHEPPARRAQLALILKSLPCLEQLERAAGERLFEALAVDHLLISFPVHSLGGRHKGMTENYARRFEALVAGRAWTARRFAFATELAYLVSR